MDRSELSVAQRFWPFGCANFGLSLPPGNPRNFFYLHGI
jgi:hypothetical protein